MKTFKDYLEEKRGLWDNIHAKRARIKNGSGERMRKPGSKGAPSEADLKAANEETEIEEATPYYNKPSFLKKMSRAAKQEQQAREKKEAEAKKPVKEEQFDMIETTIEELAILNNVDSDVIWEKLEAITDEELLEYAIDAKGHKSSTGGLTQKGVDAYNAKTGGNLQTAVTTPPSKLKPGSKAANRRKSFCARMGGVDGPMKKPNGEPSRKALALRKWNC